MFPTGILEAKKARKREVEKALATQTAAIEQNMKRMSSMRALAQARIGVYEAQSKIDVYQSESIGNDVTCATAWNQLIKAQIDIDLIEYEQARMLLSDMQANLRELEQLHTAMDSDLVIPHLTAGKQ